LTKQYGTLVHDCFTNGLIYCFVDAEKRVSQRKHKRKLPRHKLSEAASKNMKNISGMPVTTFWTPQILQIIPKIVWTHFNHRNR